MNYLKLFFATFVDVDHIGKVKLMNLSLHATNFNKMAHLEALKNENEQS